MGLRAKGDALRQAHRPVAAHADSQDRDAQGRPHAVEPHRPEHAGRRRRARRAPAARHGPPPRAPRQTGRPRQKGTGRRYARARAAGRADTLDDSAGRLRARRHGKSARRNAQREDRPRPLQPPRQRRLQHAAAVRRDTDRIHQRRGVVPRRARKGKAVRRRREAREIRKKRLHHTRADRRNRAQRLLADRGRDDLPLVADTRHRRPAHAQGHAARPRA